MLSPPLYTPGTRPPLDLGAVSKLQRYHHAGHMKERVVHQEAPLVASNKAPELRDPGESPLYDPAAPAPAQLSSILELHSLSIAPVSSDQVDASLRQSEPEFVGIRRLVADQPLGLSAGSASSRTRNGDLIQRLLDKRDLRRGRRVQEVSQRNAFPVDHDHPLRSLGPLCRSDCVPSSLADAKLLSLKHSLHSTCFFSSTCSSHSRQIGNHTPCLSQSR